MKVAHLVPPKWEHEFLGRTYKMTFASWLSGQPAEYATNLRMRPRSTYLILDTHPFEKEVPLPRPLALWGAAWWTGANEVVLPDVLGDPGATLRLSWEALDKLDHLGANLPLMFVPQAETMEDWKSCLSGFLSVWAIYQWKDPLVIGLSSLRRAGSLRPRRGSRIPMMKYLAERGFAMHILGLSSISHFVHEELPAAKEHGVRGLDTCAAFALGARGLLLNSQSPRLFLGDLQKYNSLTEDRLEVIRSNISVLDNWSR